MAAKAPCPRYDIELSAVKKSPQIKELNRKYKDLFDYVSKHAGDTIKDMENLEYIYDTLHIEVSEWIQIIYK